MHDYRTITIDNLLFYRIEITSFARPEPEISGNLAYKFRKIIGKKDFSYHFKKIIVCYQKIGYKEDVLRQTACLIVNPIKVYNCGYLFDCTTVGRASD